MTLGLINTHIALIITCVSFTVPFCTWMMRGYFNGLSKELDQAAQLMAASLYALIPLTINIIFFNRNFVRGLSAGAVKE